MVLKKNLSCVLKIDNNLGTSVEQSIHRLLCITKYILKQILNVSQIN